MQTNELKKKLTEIIQNEDGIREVRIIQSDRDKINTSSNPIFKYIMNTLLNLDNSLKRVDNDSLSVGLDLISKLKPKDEIEMMLISQILQASKNTDLVLFRANNENQTSHGKQENYQRYFKSVNSLCKLIDTLTRYQKKGEQKVTVMHQHVNVSDNSQAIIGDIKK